MFASGVPASVYMKIDMSKIFHIIHDSDLKSFQKKQKVSKFREHGSQISLLGDTIQQACQHYFIKIFY